MKSRFLFRSMLVIGLTLMTTSSLAMASATSQPTATILKKIPLQEPLSIIYDPANGNVYSVTNWPNGTINVFHGTTQVANIPIPETDLEAEQDEVVVNPVNGNVYYLGTDRVVVIHGTQLLQAIDWHSLNFSSKAYTAPTAITIDPRTGDVYVANDTDGQSNSQSDIEMFNKNGKYIKTLYFKDHVRVSGMAYNSHNNQLYVVDSDSALHNAGIDIFNGGKLVQRINFPYTYKGNEYGEFTGHIIYDYDTGLIYAEELTPPVDKNSPYFIGKLAIIRNSTIIHEIEIAPQSVGEWGQMSFDPKYNNIYMNFGASNVIQVIHNYSLLSFPVPIPEHNLGIGAVTVDTKSNQVYVLVTSWGGNGSRSYMDLVSLHK